MRTIARVTRGTLTVLLAGAIMVPVVGSTAHAGNGEGKSETRSSSGANGDCGEYCSTRDGSPSRNGNGDGDAKGRPCAGCVGKADDKNPPGQYPNGSDANNGYECDGNSGIGRSNPAHTGCTPQPAPAVEEPVAAPVDTVEEPVVAPAPVTDPVAPVVEGTTIEVTPVGAKAPAEVPEVAGVREQYGPNVLGTRFSRPAAQVAATGANQGTLPYTGNMTFELLLAAIALVGTGVLVTRAGTSKA